MSTPLSIRAAAAVAGVTEKTIRRWIQRGRLPAQKVGGHYQITPDDLDRARLDIPAESVSTPVSRHKTSPVSRVQTERVDTGQPAVSTGVDIRPLVDHIASLEGKVQELTEAATIWQFRARQLEEQIKQLTAGDPNSEQNFEDTEPFTPVSPSNGPGREESAHGAETLGHQGSWLSVAWRRLTGRS